MKVIFLDIDGVLNSKYNYMEIKPNFRLYSIVFKDENEYEFRRRILDLNPEKLELLKYIIRETDAKIVITSAWRYAVKVYPLIEEYLINKGLPIIGTIPYINKNRGEEIRRYLSNHEEVEHFIILDDKIFNDFYELENYLIKTDYYDDGLSEYHVEESIKVLNRK